MAGGRQTGRIWTRPVPRPPPPHRTGTKKKLQSLQVIGCPVDGVLPVVSRLSTDFQNGLEADVRLGPTMTTRQGAIGPGD